MKYQHLVFAGLDASATHNPTPTRQAEGFLTILPLLNDEPGV